jgi:uncharacterized protein (TIGR02284 family)
MQSSESQSSDAVSVLNDLIETCRDGEKGFREAAEKAERADLKQLFARLSSQRASFVQELESQVTALGGKPAEMGHVAAVAHRGWIAVKSTVEPRTDLALLEECERGEDYAKKAFSDALAKELPTAVQRIVTRLAADVRAAHDEVRDLRNAARSQPGASG